jgi:hypothetical protein
MAICIDREPGCGKREDRLQAVLDGYAKLLWEKELALRNHRPYLAGRVTEFWGFARGQGE